MYNAMTPKKCPKCGTPIEVKTAYVYPTNPPCLQWTCPKCGETGYTSKGDVVSFGGEISVVTSDGIINAENMETPQSCDIPAKPFLQQGWECPKCGAILAPHQNYCPFCSKKESDWTTTVGTGTQPFYSECIQKDKLKTPNSNSITFIPPCETGVTWGIKQ